MKKLISTAFLSMALASAAFAGVDCKKYDKAVQLKEGDIKAQLEGQGFKVKKLSTSDNCYKLKGWDKEGNEVENYYDMHDGSVVKSEVERD